MSFRFCDPATRKWAIYWASTRRPGVIQPPAFGAFSGDTGTFEGSDTFEGRPIRVRFTWSGITTPAPRREQAFSDDGGRTRETSWVMEFTQARARRGREPLQAAPAAPPRPGPGRARRPRPPRPPS